MFTNFTQDHLDYHGTMDAYWAAKRALFDWPGLRAAVSTSTTQGAALAAELAGAADVWTVSTVGPSARLRPATALRRRPGWPSTVREGELSACRCAAAWSATTTRSNLLGVLGACARWACRWPTPPPWCPA
jgi:UDP-N-acetylmuramoyl-L-alanyl-D-glutamate--2,6-diaminopimelate ligase